VACCTQLIASTAPMADHACRTDGEQVPHFVNMATSTFGGKHPASITRHTTCHTTRVSQFVKHFAWLRRTFLEEINVTRKI